MSVQTFHKALRIKLDSATQYSGLKIKTEITKNLKIASQKFDTIQGISVFIILV